MNPVWSGFISCGIIFASLEASIEDRSLWSVFNRLIGRYDEQSVGFLPGLYGTVIIAEFHVVAHVSLSSAQL